MPVQPTFLERAAFYSLNQAPGVLLDIAGAISYQATSTAMRLGVFDALADRPMTAPEMAAALELQERGISSLLQALSTTGYVDCRDGRYVNSSMTDKWLIGDNAIDGRALMSFWNDTMADIWPTAGDVIRTGKRPFDVYDWIESDPVRNRSFQQTLVVTAHNAGADIAKAIDLPDTARRILDVGGGHGLFSINMCQRYPNLRATIVERPAVVEVAAGYVDQYGMNDRIDFICGDMWESDWGRDYDAVLLFNLLHHFDTVTNAKLLRQVNQVLRPGGRVAVLDQIAGKATVSATSAFIQLIALQYYIMADGRVFTHDELTDLLTHTGFDDIRAQRLQKLPGTSLMFATKR